MHISTIFVAALAGLASAGPATKRQNTCPEVEAIPRCGYSCIVSAGSNLGCASEDYACMCGRFNELQDAAGPCVIQNCGEDGAPAVLAAAQAVCDACIA